MEQVFQDEDIPLSQVALELADRLFWKDGPFVDPLSATIPRPIPRPLPRPIQLVHHEHTTENFESATS